MSCSKIQHSDAVRLEPMAPPSRAKHSTTEPLCSLLPRLSSVGYTLVVMYMDFYGSYVTLLLCQYDVKTLHLDLFS